MKIYSFQNLLRLCLINFFIFAGFVIFIGQKQILLPEKPKETDKSIATNLGPLSSNVNPTASVLASVASPTPIPKQIPLIAQVGQHKTKDDCWIIYSGRVYEITSYFGSHPGGDAIMLKYCGVDATAAFDSKDQSPASAHSQSASVLLSQYLLE